MGKRVGVSLALFLTVLVLVLIGGYVLLAPQTRSDLKIEAQTTTANTNDARAGSASEEVSLSPDALLKMGIWSSQGYRYDEAARKFDQVLALHPKSEPALVFGGIAYLGKGETETALRYFKKALSLPAGKFPPTTPPSNYAADSYLTAGDLYLSRKEYANATRAYERALALDATCDEARRGLREAKAAAVQ